MVSASEKTINETFGHDTGDQNTNTVIKNSLDCD